MGNLMFLMIFVFKPELTQSTKACFLLGSNLGNRMDYLRRARQAISQQLGSLYRISGVYSSPSWGYKSDRDFLNQAVLIETLLEPAVIMEAIHNIEGRLGRKRSGSGYNDRTIDIDILFYGQEVIDEPGLTIPHPRLHQRRFALLPLGEIASEWEHPILKKQTKEMLAECADDSVVVPWKEIQSD